MIKIKKNGHVWETNTHTDLKYSIVDPFFKNVDRLQTANYRVISSITGFYKIFEILIYHQVLFSPTHALFHTTMYQSFKLY